MKPKVLMIGWYYAPEISGGMGKAWTNIAQTVAPYVDLTIITPLWDAPFLLPQSNIIETDLFDNQASIELKLKIRKSSSIIQQMYHFGPYGSISNNTDSNNDKNNDIEEQPISISNEEILLEKPYDLFKLIVEQYNSQINEFIKNHNFDIVWCHDWIGLPIAMKIRYEQRIPMIYHVHSLETQRTTLPNRNHDLFSLERKGLDVADVVITVSQKTKQEIVKRYDTWADKIKTVYPIKYHNAINLNSKNYKEKAPSVLFMGRLTEQKGIWEYIQIAENIININPSIHFYIAGDGPLASQVIQYLAVSPVKENLHYLGFIEQDKKEEVFRNHEILIMPSIEEPFGIVCIEAIKAGLLSIISNNTGAAEIIDKEFVYTINGEKTAESLLVKYIQDPTLIKTANLKQQENLLKLNDQGENFRNIIYKLLTKE